MQDLRAWAAALTAGALPTPSVVALHALRRLRSELLDVVPAYTYYPQSPHPDECVRLGLELVRRAATLGFDLV